MTLRDMQRAADDLGDVENALWNIRRLLTEAVSTFPTIRVIPPSERKVPPARFKKPDLPRCSAVSVTKGRPCVEPATYPLGLCAQHFIVQFGHRFRPEGQAFWLGEVICQCGARHLYKDHAKHPHLREYCPLKKEKQNGHHRD